MRTWIVAGLLAVAAACSDDEVSNIADLNLRLSGTMKLVADSVTTSLRITNTSNVTQVLGWSPCPSIHPANFALYSDAQLRTRIWERRMGGCTLQALEHMLAPGASFTLRGTPVAVTEILRGSVAPGRYYLAIVPRSLGVRPLGSTTDTETAVRALVSVGPIDLSNR